MRCTIGLSCDDARLFRALARWLEHTGLEPPGELTLDVRAADTAPPPDARPPFRQPGVVVRSGPPEGGVRLWWEVAPAFAELAPGTAVARVTLSRAAIRQLDLCTGSFLMTVLVFLLRRAGWHHVHAATAVDPATGRGWLIAGDAAAGKSTTAALLATRGWGVGTDDLAFLTAGVEGRVTVAACRAPIALRVGGRRLLRLIGGSPRAERDKFTFWPEELGGVWAPRVVPDVILFPAIGDGRTTATALGPREALAELVRWSAWVVLEPELAQAHLDLLGALARQARAFRVTLGRDLFDHPDRLAELVA